MISVEELDALDLLIWLGRGEDAARRQSCNQSTISRRCQAVLRTFDLRLQKDDDGWPCTRQHDLLQRERTLHQLYRLRSGLPLRVDASLLAAPLLRPGVPPGWWRGALEEVGWQRPLHLLKERILDAWISGMAQELPQLEQSWFLTIPLLHTPLQLAAGLGDPLLQERGLSGSDVAAIPRLAPRQGSYARTERLLGAWRLNHQPFVLESQPHRRHLNSGRRPERGGRVLHYTTAVSVLERPDLRVLDLPLGIQTDTCLVLHRDLAEEPRLQELLRLLQRRAADLSAQSSLVATP